LFEFNEDTQDAHLEEHLFEIFAFVVKKSNTGKDLWKSRQMIYDVLTEAATAKTSQNPDHKNTKGIRDSFAYQIGDPRRVCEVTPLFRAFLYFTSIDSFFTCFQVR